MVAIITGASSGIGKDIAHELAKRGYEIIAVARDEEKLNKLKEEIPQVIKCIPMDLSIRDNCFKLHKMTKNMEVDILVNNIGFDKAAHVKFRMNYLTSEYVAKCGVKAMFKGKWCVTPGITGKIDKLCAKILPDKFMAKVVGIIPRKSNEV